MSQSNILCRNEETIKTKSKNRDTFSIIMENEGKSVEIEQSKLQGNIHIFHHDGKCVALNYM